jgi:peptide/nickel transport system ATP-binding protein
MLSIRTGERTGDGDTMRRLEISDLTITYRSGNRQRTAVEDANLTVERGDLVALVGESGAGKSTLARAVAGIHEPATIQSGSILLDDRGLTGASTEKWREIRGSRVGFAFQDPTTAFDPVYTLGEQLGEAIRAGGTSATDGSLLESASRRFRRRSLPRHRDRAIALLEEVGIDDPEACLDAYPSELSGGQCQRAFLATALAGEPDILVADEPASGLDATTQARVLALLEDLSETRDLGVLLVTHDLGLASEHCDHISVLADGRTVDSGPVEELLADPDHTATESLVTAARTLTLPDRQPVSVDGCGASPGPRPTTDETIVSVCGLTKRYPVDDTIVDRLLNDRSYLTALDDVSLDVRRGETLGVVGPSGSGKSTIVECIAGLTEPTTGDVRIDGRPVGRVSSRDIELLGRVGVVFQQPKSSLNPQWSLRRSIAEPLSRRGWAGDRIDERVSELCSLVDLSRSVAASRPDAVSGGQAQRAALARAIADDPDILLLDEPVSALDATTRAEVVSLLGALQASREGASGTVVVSHDLGTVGQLADRIVVLDDGAIAERGPADELLSAPEHPRTRALLDAVPNLPAAAETRALSTGIPSRNPL